MNSLVSEYAGDLLLVGGERGGGLEQVVLERLTGGTEPLDQAGGSVVLEILLGGLGWAKLVGVSALSKLLHFPF